MKNILGWAKGLGIVIGSAIAFSGTSAVANIHQDATLTSNLNFATQGNIRIFDGSNKSVNNLSPTVLLMLEPSALISTVINAEKLPQVQLEIDNELSNILSQSNFTYIFKTYGLSDIDLIMLKLKNSPTKLNLDVGIDKIKVASLLVSPAIGTLDCDECVCWCIDPNGGGMYRCPCP
ncbi:hypothetical protein Cylst_2417 [Cylindrospermum stagnale PCC 7417]|uniref:Uncharacterized protein n=1 Tax=Cylindrospermum stagnale PCC 7417 TaxID=56107 RepID=K9WXW6_9NOST|nr:hypothetical protein [Cylindrospermum stagnale]AFZ24636.1 hypothetical protein Cylst_2417 [Cylindrospermum stagnale PCC 7417]